MSEKLDGLVTEEIDEDPAIMPVEGEPTEAAPAAASVSALEDDGAKKLKLVDDMYLHCDNILRKYGY